MWKTDALCPKCRQIHTLVYKGKEKPAEGEELTYHCLKNYMPVYLTGGHANVTHYRKGQVRQVPIEWEEVDEMPEGSQEIKKWVQKEIIY